MGYLNNFLKLDCSNDVLTAVGRVNNLSKEITESMAVIKQIKKIVYSSKDEYILHDLCAGNALTSVISSHLFKLKKAIAYDKTPRIREWNFVKRFEYKQIDIYNLPPSLFDNEASSIIIGVHACKDLAERIIEIYNRSNASYLILMPCCRKKVLSSEIPRLIQAKIGGYLAWCYHLSNLCQGKVKMVEDEDVLSPCNCIIVASKQKGASI